MGNPLVAGRDLEWSDIYDRRPVAVITENLAREYWENPRAALGKRIATIAIDDGGAGAWREIVGVVGDVHDDGVDQPTPPIVYWPIAQENWYTEAFLSSGPWPTC